MVTILRTIFSPISGNDKVPSRERTSHAQGHIEKRGELKSVEALLGAHAKQF